jgi:4-diphosphocytidyl-2-C-methyl-D-erythritol kinase
MAEVVAVLSGGDQSMLKLASPAKLNLSLEILGRRPDGYHEVLSVMQSVSLCDQMVFEPNSCLEISCDLPGWQAEKSLVLRAAHHMAERAGSVAGVSIRIAKQIPLSSGLGGDSSNAATALIGLNRLWKLGLSVIQLQRIAAGLGTDVPFFLRGGTALVAGRGERLTPLPPVKSLHAVILHPGLARPEKKTANLYNMLETRDYSDGSRTRELAETIAGGSAVEAELLHNSFEGAALRVFNGLAEIWQQFKAAGAAEVHLAGSGPALFAVFNDAESARDVCARLKSLGLDAWTAESMALKTKNG